MVLANYGKYFYAHRFRHGDGAARAFTAVPAHLAFVVAGYYAGLAKILSVHPFRLLWQGFGMAIFCCTGSMIF